MKTNFIISLPPSSLRIGLVEAQGVTVKPSNSDYLAEIDKDIAPILSPDYVYPDKMQKGIRSLLRTFGFHPSGRSRPASEFLAKDLGNRGSFNPINNVVDINNHISLLYNLPISVIDLDKSGSELSLRVGAPEEKYIFNREGQELTLKNLIVIAKNGDSHKPIGSPVKDSQETKVFENTKNILFVIYTSSTITTECELKEINDRIALLLDKECSPERIKTAIIDS